MSRATANTKDANAVGMLRMTSPYRMNALNGIIVDIRTPRWVYGEKDFVCLTFYKLMCVDDSFTTSFITPKLIHGPGNLINNEETSYICQNEQSIFADCSNLASQHNLPTNNLPSKDTLQSTLTRFQLGRYDPKSSLSVIFEVNRQLDPDREHFAHIQFVTRYIDPHDKNYLMTRVSSQIFVPGGGR